jgi:restriction endonuclease S subunit
MCTAYLKDINNLRLFLHEKADQIRIAKLLSSVDCLIAGEKQKVDLLKKQRKTLQRYLLNGIVRA